MNEFRKCIQNTPYNSNIKSNDNMEVIAHKEDIVDYANNVGKLLRQSFFVIRDILVLWYVIVLKYDNLTHL